LGGLEVSGEDAPQGGYDIVLFPPEDETLTDEDSDDEDEDQATKNPNHLGKGILSQQAELVAMDNDELPDLTVVRNFCYLLVHLYSTVSIHNCTYNFIYVHRSTLRER
jgi:hypothetical protein